MRRVHGLGGALTAVTGIFGRATNQIVALVVTLLAARWLTPTTFGAFAIAAALATLSRAMLYAGAFEYLLKAPKGEEANSECLAINLGLACVLASLMAAGSLFADQLFHSPDVGWLILWLSPSSLLSAAANWQESQLLRAGRLKTYYAVTTTSEIASAGLTVGLILSGFGLSALVAQIYGRLLALIVTYRALQRPVWSKRFSTARAWRVARWSTARYGTTIINFLSNYSADILLGVFLSPAATGIYRASHRMVTAVSDLINNPTRLTAVTIFSRRAAERRPPGDLWSRISGATVLLGWTALAGLAAISGRGAPMLLGPRWIEAGPIVAILCLQRAFSLVDGITGPLLVAYSHTRSLLFVQIAMAGFGVVLLVISARFGVTAAAFSSVAAAGGTTVLMIGLARRFFPDLLANGRRVLPVALGPALATSCAAWVAQTALAGRNRPPTDVIGLQVVAGALAFALAVVAMRREIVEILQALNQPVAPSPVEVAEEEAEIALAAG